MQLTNRKGMARWLAVLAIVAVIATACSSDDTDATTTTADDQMELTPVKLQMQWFTQAQFAGYYAALAEGYYEDAGLDVTILEGGVDIVPATVLDSGEADFALSWAIRALAPREEGADVTNISQVFERSATLQVSFADAGISTPSDLEGKNVGNWGFGNEAELFAGLRQAGLDPFADVNLVQQQFDMLALISGDIDAAQAMTYNEYAQVLETVNPDTGELYQPEDLSAIDWNEVGTAMLQDAIWADADRLANDPAYRETAVKFVEASLRGWVFCRDNFDACVQHVLDAGPTLGESHQRWMLNEINNLIWPSSHGIGTMDTALWDQTIKNAVDGEVLKGVPTEGAYVTDINDEALKNLRDAGVDVDGNGWTPKEIVLNEGGN
ncbi:MAG: ABC transporter substrate-binding protein [Acidimicrobiia bacterium]